MRIEYKDKGLDALIAALKGKLPVARVGVLGNNNARQGGETNAAIGLDHEFGRPDKNLPMRSWLRVPLIENFQKFFLIERSRYLRRQ